MALLLIVKGGVDAVSVDETDGVKVIVPGVTVPHRSIGTSHSVGSGGSAASAQSRVRSHRILEKTYAQEVIYYYKCPSKLMG